ncbi:MAG: hypothetical protein RL026_2309 [Pseudomonadota bacterium]|jgi:hypothetical protein
MNMDDLQPTLRILGYGGLLPFAGASAGVFLAPDEALRATSLQALLVYAAVIASFLGALWWGQALCRTDLEPARRRGLLVSGVLPSLIAWLAVLAGGGRGLAMLGVLLLLVWRTDERWAVPLAYPPAWLRLRRELSVGAAVCVLLPLVVL